MARGWESKSVEEQQAERSQPEHHGARLTVEQAAVRRQLDALLLSLKSVEHSLAQVTQSGRREMLQRSAADLQAKIAMLQSAR